MNDLSKVVFTMVLLLVNGLVLAQDFRSFQEKFPLVSAFQIDSLFIDTFRLNPSLELTLLTNDQSFVPIDLKEKCFKKTAQFHLQPFAKLATSGDFVYLILYAELNRQCEYDGFEKRFWLVTYQQDGTILRTTRVGGELSLFAYVAYTFSAWSGGNEIRINEVEYSDEKEEISSNHRSILKLN